MKRHSTVLIFREIRYHFTLVNMTITAPYPHKKKKRKKKERKEKKITNVGKSVDKLENLCIVAM